MIGAWAEGEGGVLSVAQAPQKPLPSDQCLTRQRWPSPSPGLFWVEAALTQNTIVSGEQGSPLQRKRKG